jgi:hypothetical protein
MDTLPDSLAEVDLRILSPPFLTLRHFIGTWNYLIILVIVIGLPSISPHRKESSLRQGPYLYLTASFEA